MRWKLVFLPAKEVLAEKDCAEAPGAGLAPLVLCAAFSSMAWSFCSLGLRPVVRLGAAGLAGGAEGFGIG